MRFFDAVPEVMALLQRDARISYRALQYAFGFDTTFLEVLREELLFRGIARDDAGRGLVWTGSPSLLAPSPAVPCPHCGRLETPRVPPVAVPILPLSWVGF